jgi:uncharacterized membrane protein YbhN (UPF0104 family)
MLKTKTKIQNIQKPAIWNALKIAFAITLSLFVISQTRTSELIALWQRISVPWLLGSVLAFCAITWSMARRYWILIDRKITFRQTLGLVIIQTIVGNLFATSAGAVSYVTILRSKYQIQVSQGVASILLAKFGDLLALFVALALSSWVVWSQIGPLRWLIALLLAGIASVIVTFALIFLFRQRVVRIIKRILGLLHMDRIAFVQRTFTQLAALPEQEPGRLRAQLGGFIGYSGLTLALTFVFGYCNMRLFAVSIGAWPVLFMISLIQLLSIIPIQVFGGLGVYEVTSLYLYGLFSISRPEIVPVIISSRIYLYLLNLLLLLYLPLDSRLGREEVKGGVGAALPPSKPPVTPDY